MKKGVSITTPIEYIIAIIILLVELFIFVSFFRAIISNSVQNPSYLLFLNQLYFERLNYCTYIITNDTDFLFYIPNKANYTEEFINRFGDRYNDYLGEYSYCFSPIYTSFSNTTKFSIENGVAKYEAIEYKIITVPIFAFYGVNNNNIYIFNDVYIKNNILSIAYKVFKTSQFDIFNIFSFIYEKFISLYIIFISDYLKDLIKLYSYKNLGVYEMYNEATIENLTKEYYKMLEEVGRNEKDGLFISAMLYYPLLAIDESRDLYVENLYTFGWIRAKKFSGEIEIKK